MVARTHPRRTPKRSSKTTAAGRTNGRSKNGARKARTRPKDRPKGPRASWEDKHRLYQISVQDPDFEIDLLSRIGKRRLGRKPLHLREDFCGTALLCSRWVKTDAKRTATGLDLDRGVLAWGEKHNVVPLGEDASRVTLLHQDVLEPTRGKRFDITVAYNYSYFIFRTRDELKRYFRNVKRSLVPGGLFFMDMYGGYEAQEPHEEVRREGDFTYIWDQDDYNPVDGSAVNHIHFKFRDGSEMRRAFTYRWRLWSMVELLELLDEAGFEQVEVYGEDEDADGDPTGTYRKRVRLPPDPAWNAYLVAKKPGG